MNTFKFLKLPLAVLTFTAFVSPTFANEMNDTTKTTHTAVKTTTKTEKVSDSTIVSDIKNKLSQDKLTSGMSVDVSSHNGVVTLKGNVNTDEEASRAIEIAESTPGIKNVEASHLTVKESKQPFADLMITAKVKGTYAREKLMGDKDISLMGIKVETTNGVVYLTGMVDTKAQADNAIKLAKNIKDVKKVDSKLEVKPADSSKNGE